MAPLGSRYASAERRDDVRAAAFRGCAWPEAEIARSSRNAPIFDSTTIRGMVGAGHQSGG